MEIKKILFPTDFSEGAGTVAPFALDLARKYGAELIIIHVIYDIAKSTGWYVPHISTDEIYAEMEAEAKKELEKCFIEELRTFNNKRCEVLKGVPHEEVLRYAEENSIDLIILGTHGRKGVDRLFFGSTAEKVVRQAQCPVLTVRTAS